MLRRSFDSWIILGHLARHLCDLSIALPEGTLVYKHMEDTLTQHEGEPGWRVARRGRRVPSGMWLELMMA